LTYFEPQSETSLKILRVLPRKSSIYNSRRTSGSLCTCSDNETSSGSWLENMSGITFLWICVQLERNSSAPLINPQKLISFLRVGLRTPLGRHIGGAKNYANALNEWIIEWMNEWMPDKSNGFTAAKLACC